MGRAGRWGGGVVAGLMLAACTSTTAPAVPEPPNEAREETKAELLEAPFGRPELDPGLAGSRKRDDVGPAPRFAWTACRVGATYFSSGQDDGAGLATMTMVLTPAGDGLALHFEDISVQMAGDVRLGEAAAERERAILEAATLLALPSRMVGSNGSDGGPVSVETAMAAALSGLGAKDAQALEDVIRSPTFQAGLDQAGADLHRLLWGEWADFTAGSVEVATDWGGATLPETVERRHLGQVRDNGDLVLLETRRELGGPDFLEILWQRGVARAEAAGQEPPPRDALRSGRRVELRAAAIEPSTGRVHHALSQSIFEVNDKRRLEVEEWAFDWTRSDCGPH